MSVIKFIASDGIEHNLSPHYVVDAYMTQYPNKNEWCLTIKFSKDACIPGNVYTKAYTNENECRQQLLQINSVR